MSLRIKSLLAIHIAVFFFGTAGLFGKLLPLESQEIVFGRTFFAGLTLFILAGTRGSSEGVRKYLSPRFVPLGSILAFHWYAFYYSIQVSSVAVGLLTFSCFPIVTTFLEPLFFNTKLSRADVTSAALVSLGLYLVVPEFSFENDTTQGVVWGLSSGISFSLLQIGNKKMVLKSSALGVSLGQSFYASLALVPFTDLGFLGEASPRDLFLLVILGVVFTALAHTLFICGLRHIRAQQASVISALEPVYGILLAALVLGSYPDQRTLLGGAIILSTVILSSIPKKTRGVNRES